MLFGVPATRDAVGSGATDPDGILNVAVARRRGRGGRRTWSSMADLCLDEFTDHGHCGVLARRRRDVDNDATLVRYADDGRGPGRGRRPRRRDLGDDGRPGRRRARRRSTPRGTPTP